MTNEQLAEAIRVMQAALDGAEVQGRECRLRREGWRTITCPSWNWELSEYRVAPKEVWIARSSYALRAFESEESAKCHVSGAAGEWTIERYIQAEEGESDG